MTSCRYSREWKGSNYADMKCEKNRRNRWVLLGNKKWIYPKNVFNKHRLNFLKMTSNADWLHYVWLVRQKCGSNQISCTITSLLHKNPLHIVIFFLIEFFRDGNASVDSSFVRLKKHSIRPFVRRNNSVIQWMVNFSLKILKKRKKHEYSRCNWKIATYNCNFVIDEVLSALDPSINYLGSSKNLASVYMESHSCLKW